MLSRKLVALILAALPTLALTEAAIAQLTDVLSLPFPQIVQGRLSSGEFAETTITITNPGLEPAALTLWATAQDHSPLLPRTSLTLAAGETRTFNTVGQTLRVGYGVIESARPLVAAAHIIVRSSADSPQVISQVTIPAQPPASKVVVPVFRKTSAASTDSLADDTAIALVTLQGGPVLLTLQDSFGAVVATRLMRPFFGLSPFDFGGHLALFIAELFPGLPVGFSAGSLTIETFEVARNLAVTALYTQGSRIWAAPAIAIDVPRNYILRVPDPKLLDELVSHHGFVIVYRSAFDSTLALIRSTDEIARALDRDPRVTYIHINHLIPLA